MKKNISFLAKKEILQNKQKLKHC